MTPTQFVHALQIVDSLFPVGAFAYSDGLETAVAHKHVDDTESFATWLNNNVDAMFVTCDGLALLKSWRASRRRDWMALQSIDEELTALKPAREVRGSSISIGKRILETYRRLVADEGELLPLLECLPRCNAPIAYGVVFSHIDLDARESLLAFGYGRLAGTVSAALRLIPLGQQQGQTLLTAMLDHLPAAVERILDNEEEPLRSFSPLLDVQQMNHRYVYSRLFRS
jgi:urease accessory protein